MDPSTLNTLIGSGPFGIFAFIAWLYLQQQKGESEKQREERVQRLAADKDRTETDKKLAASITTLAMRVTGRPADGDAS